MNRIQKAAILILLLIFDLLAFPIGILFTLWAMLKLSPHVIEVTDALNRFIAATLGWSGKHKVSSECAVSTTLPARMLHDLLNSIETNHCENSAKREGLL